MALSLSSLPLIGLLCKGKLNYGMMSIIIVTMMRLLSGRIGVRQKTRKKRQKNSGGGLFDMLRLKMY